MSGMNVAVQHTGEPMIQVFDTYCVLNAAAVQLLGLTVTSHCVRLMRDGCKLYIGHTNVVDSCPVMLRRNGTGRICSQFIARYIADTLQGRGTYRICPESYRLDITDRMFEILNYKIRKNL